MIGIQKKDEMRMEVENDLAKTLETVSNENMEKLDESCEQETRLIDIKNIMENLKLTFDQAMDALNIPQSQRDTYAGLVEKKT